MEELLGTLYLGKRFERPTVTPLLLSRPTQQLPLGDQPSFLSHSHGSVQLADSASAIIVSPDSQELIATPPTMVAASTGAATSNNATTTVQRSPDRTEVVAPLSGAAGAASHSHSPSPHRRSSALSGAVVGGEVAAACATTTISPMRDMTSPFVASVPALALQRSSRAGGTMMSGGGGNGALMATTTTMTAVTTTDGLQKSMHERPMRVPVGALEGSYVLLLLCDPKAPAAWTTPAAGVGLEGHGEDCNEPRMTESRPGQSLSLPGSRLDQHLSPHQSPPVPHDANNLSERTAATTTTATTTATAWPHPPLPNSGNEPSSGRATVTLSPGTLALFSAEAGAGPRATPHERPAATTQSLSTVLLPPTSRPGLTVGRRWHCVERKLLAFYCLLLRHLQSIRRSPGLDESGGVAKSETTSECAKTVSAPIAVLEVRYTPTVHSLGPTPISLPPLPTTTSVLSGGGAAAGRGSGGGGAGGGSYGSAALPATGAAAANTASAPGVTTSVAAPLVGLDAPTKDSQTAALADSGVVTTPIVTATAAALTMNNVGSGGTVAQNDAGLLLNATTAQTERREKERLESSAREQSSHPLFYLRGSVDGENCASTLRRLLASECDESVALDAFFFDEELQSSPHYRGWFYLESGEAYRRLLRHFSVRSWPTVLLLDPSGRLVAHDALARLESELIRCVTQLEQRQQRAALHSASSSPRQPQQQLQSVGLLPTMKGAASVDPLGSALGQSVPRDGQPLAMTGDSSALVDEALAVSGSGAAGELSAQRMSDVFGAGGLHLSTLLNSQSFGTNTNTSSSLAAPDLAQPTVPLEQQQQPLSSAIPEGAALTVAEPATARPSHPSPNAVAETTHFTDDAAPHSPSTPTEAAADHQGGVHTAVTTPSTANPTPLKDMPVTARYVEPGSVCSPEVSYRNSRNSSSESPAARAVGEGQGELVAAAAVMVHETNTVANDVAASVTPNNAVAAAPQTSLSPSPSLQRRSRTGSTTDSMLQAHYRFPPWSGPRWASSEPGEEEEEVEEEENDRDDDDEVARVHDADDVDAAVTALTSAAGPRPGIARLRRPSHTPQPGALGDGSSVLSQPTSLSLGRQGSGQVPLFGLPSGRLLNATQEAAVAAMNTTTAAAAQTSTTTATAWLHSVPFVSAFPWTTTPVLAESDAHGGEAVAAAGVASGRQGWVRSVATVRHAIERLATPDAQMMPQPRDPSHDVSTEVALADLSEDGHCVRETLQKATALVLLFGAAWHPAMTRTLQRLQQVLKTTKAAATTGDAAFAGDASFTQQRHLSEARDTSCNVEDTKSNSAECAQGPRWSLRRVVSEDCESEARPSRQAQQDFDDKLAVLFVSADESEKDLHALLRTMSASWLCVSPLLWGDRHGDSTRATLAEQFVQKTMSDYVVDLLPRLVVLRKKDGDADYVDMAGEVRTEVGAWRVVERHAERQLFAAATSSETPPWLQECRTATKPTPKPAETSHDEDKDRRSEDEVQGCSDASSSAVHLFAAPPITTSLADVCARTDCVSLHRPDALPSLLETGGYFVVLCALGAVDARLHAQCARALELAGSQILRDLRQLKEQAMEASVNNKTSMTAMQLERPSQSRVAATALPPPSVTSALGLSSGSGMPAAEANLTRWLAGLMTQHNNNNNNSTNNNNNAHSGLNAHAYYYISHPPAPSSGSSPGSPLRPTRPIATNKEEGNATPATAQTPQQGVAAASTSAPTSSTTTTTASPSTIATTAPTTTSQAAASGAAASAMRGPLSAHEYPLHSHSPLMTHTGGGGGGSSLGATTVVDLGNTVSPGASSALSGFGQLPAVYFFDAVYRDVSDEDEANEELGDASEGNAPSFAPFAGQVMHEEKSDVRLIDPITSAATDKETSDGADLPATQRRAIDAPGERGSQQADSSSSCSATQRLDQTEEACARYRDSLALLQEYILAPIIDQDERQLPPREGELFLACVRLPQRTTSVLRRRLQSDTATVTTAGAVGGTSANASATASATMPPLAGGSVPTSAAAATGAVVGGGGNGGAAGHGEAGARLPPVAPSSVSNEPGSFPSGTNSFSNTATTSSNMEGSLKDTTTAPSEPDPMPLTSPDVIWQFVWEQLWCTMDV